MVSGFRFSDETTARAESRQRVIAERSTQILQATARVISARGAANTRLTDVAHEAGVSVGLVQHYFGSKQELMAAAFKFFNDQWIDGWEAAANSEPEPIKKLMLLLRHSAFEFQEWREVQWRIWIEFWSICSRDPAFDALYPQIYERFHAPFRDAITAGLQSGTFTIQGTVDDVVDRLTAEIDGLRVRVLLQPKGSSMTPMSRERMFSLLVRSAQEQLGCPFPVPTEIDAEHPSVHLETEPSRRPAAWPRPLGARHVQATHPDEQRAAARRADPFDQGTLSTATHSVDDPRT